MEKLKYALFIFLPVCITTILWIYAKPSIQLAFVSPLTAITQLTALWGLTLMAISMLLSSRFRILENILGSLDRQYRIHSTIGMISFILIMLHPITLVINYAATTLSAAIALLVPGAYLPYDLGQLSFYIMVFSFLNILFIKLPYITWKNFHKLLVPAFIIGSLHTLLAKSDVKTFPPLYIWTYIIFTIGTISGFYILFFYNKFGKHVQYRIHKIIKNGTNLDLDLVPIDNALSYEVGQFIYVKFYNKKIGSELHPFSISTVMNEGFIRISIKVLGDFTQSLYTYLQEGELVEIYGPYGRLGGIYKKNKNLIWIAGGIGVTPFLAMLHAEIFAKSHNSVYFFYSHRTPYEDMYQKEIETFIPFTPHIKYFDWESHAHSRLTAQNIIDTVPDIQNYTIILCGPPPMMNSLIKQFLEKGVKKENIINEDFSFI